MSREHGKHLGGLMRKQHEERNLSKHQAPLHLKGLCKIWKCPRYFGGDQLFWELALKRPPDLQALRNKLGDRRAKFLWVNDLRARGLLVAVLTPWRMAVIN